MGKEMLVKPEKELFKPLVGSLFIDKLVIVIDYPAHYHPIIKEKFINIQNHFGKPFHSRAYSFGVILSDNSVHFEGLTIMQCAPINSNYNFFRLEMNPARADLAYIKTIADMILPDGYAGLLLNGIVNRIDCSVDISNVKISELIAEYPRMRIEGHHRMGAAKETKKLGSNVSKTQVTMYDKSQQLLALTGPVFRRIFQSV